MNGPGGGSGSALQAVAALKTEFAEMKQSLGAQTQAINVQGSGLEAVKAEMRQALLEQNQNLEAQISSLTSPTDYQVC